MMANRSIVEAKILTSLSALTLFAALSTFLICTLTIENIHISALVNNFDQNGKI